MGGMACVGISSLSLANMAESDSRPFALFMSATCRSVATVTHSSGQVSALNGAAENSSLSGVESGAWSHRNSVSDGKACHCVQLCHLKYEVFQPAAHCCSVPKQLYDRGNAFGFRDAASACESAA